MTAIIDDTYAEAFRSVYTEFLVTARDRRWLDHAVQAATRSYLFGQPPDCRDLSVPTK